MGRRPNPAGFAVNRLANLAVFSSRGRPIANGRGPRLAIVAQLALLSAWRRRVFPTIMQFHTCHAVRRMPAACLPIGGRVRVPRHRAVMRAVPRPPRKSTDRGPDRPCLFIPRVCVVMPTIDRVCHERDRLKCVWRLSLVLTLSAVGCTSLVWPASAAADEPAAVDFNEQIKPILSDRCYFCHGPDAENRQADLRLDSREQAMRESFGEAPHIITPGKPSQSELYLAITSQDDRCACHLPRPSWCLAMTKRN